MNWSEADPGQGSPAGIQGVAALRTARAARVRDAQRTIQSVASQSGVEWEAASQRSFAAELSKKAADIELVATGLEKQATALTTYAGALTQIKDRQVVLETRRATAEQHLSSARAMMPFPELFPQTTSPLLTGKPAPDDEAAKADLARQKAKAQGLIDHAQSDLRAIDAEWDTLVSDRRRIDATCAAALQNQDVLGGLSNFSGVDVASKSPEDLLALLVGLSATDREMLLADNPDLAKTIAAASPEAVAAWWTAIGDTAEPTAFSEQQQWFLATMPVTMGALDGLAPQARVAANKTNAQARLDADQDELYSVMLSISVLEGHVGTRALEKRRAELEAEIAYLKDAVGDSPTRQLYVYDPDRSRIIEMEGTITDQTKHVITYTPGTFADLAKFYDGSTQAIASSIVAGHPDTVVFVYKDGRYPGEHGQKSDMDLTKILEANDEDFALQSGKQLASFEQGLNASSPIVRAAESTAIAHSWGLANVTSAEVAGAHWDNVVSLAGAGMPKQWSPDPSTNYVHESYPDLLWEAQLTGQVWDSRNPGTSDAFDQHFYGAPESFIKTGSVMGVDYAYPDQSVLLDNHNLIASNARENRAVLDHIEKIIYGVR